MNRGECEACGRSATGYCRACPLQFCSEECFLSEWHPITCIEAKRKQNEREEGEEPGESQSQSESTRPGRPKRQQRTRKSGSSSGSSSSTRRKFRDFQTTTPLAVPEPRPLLPIVPPTQPSEMIPMDEWRQRMRDFERRLDLFVLQARILYEHEIMNTCGEDYQIMLEKSLNETQDGILKFNTVVSQKMGMMITDTDMANMQKLFLETSQRIEEDIARVQEAYLANCGHLVQEVEESELERNNLVPGMTVMIMHQRIGELLLISFLDPNDLEIRVFEPRAEEGQRVRELQPGELSEEERARLTTEFTRIRQAYPDAQPAVWEWLLDETVLFTAKQVWRVGPQNGRAIQPLFNLVPSRLANGSEVVGIVDGKDKLVSKSGSKKTSESEFELVSEYEPIDTSTWILVGQPQDESELAVQQLRSLVDMRKEVQIVPVGFERGRKPQDPRVIRVWQYPTFDQVLGAMQRRLVTAGKWLNVIINSRAIQFLWRSLQLTFDLMWQAIFIVGEPIMRNPRRALLFAGAAVTGMLLLKVIVPVGWILNLPGVGVFAELAGWVSQIHGALRAVYGVAHGALGVIPLGLGKLALDMSLKYAVQMLVVTSLIRTWERRQGRRITPDDRAVIQRVLTAVWIVTEVVTVMLQNLSNSPPPEVPAGGEYAVGGTVRRGNTKQDVNQTVAVRGDSTLAYGSVVATENNTAILLETNGTLSSCPANFVKPDARGFATVDRSKMTLLEVEPNGDLYCPANGLHLDKDIGWRSAGQVTVDVAQKLNADLQAGRIDDLSNMCPAQPSNITGFGSETSPEAGFQFPNQPARVLSDSELSTPAEVAQIVNPSITPDDAQRWNYYILPAMMPPQAFNIAGRITSRTMDYLGSAVMAVIGVLLYIRQHPI